MEQTELFRRTRLIFKSDSSSARHQLIKLLQSVPTKIKSSHFLNLICWYFTILTSMLNKQMTLFTVLSSLLCIGTWAYRLKQRLPSYHWGRIVLKQCKRHWWERRQFLRKANTSMRKLSNSLIRLYMVMRKVHWAWSLLKLLKRRLWLQFRPMVYWVLWKALVGSL